MFTFERRASSTMYNINSRRAIYSFLYGTGNHVDLGDWSICDKLFILYKSKSSRHFYGVGQFRSKSGEETT